MISISTVFAELLEYIMFENIPILLDSNLKQFGYKRNMSCKSAYFHVNLQTIQSYKRGKSNIYLISLDASKAFDKLWRSRLFHKLIDVIEPSIWRILFIDLFGEIKQVSFKNTQQ